MRIRRDHTFEFRGERYYVGRGSPRPERDGSRFIARIVSDVPGDWEVVAEGFGYLSEVRDYVDRAERRGWDRIY